MVKKTKTTPTAVGDQARIGIVIYTPEGILIPSAATLAKMKAAQAKAKKK